MSRSLAEHFCELHRMDTLLVVPNVWDVLSARLAEGAGARALATSSAAVSWSLGYADGERLPLDELVAVVGRITRATTLPVTIDFERGYGDSGAEVAAAVERLVEAGAVGVNLEDGGAPARTLAEKVRSVKTRLGSRVFVNARTCVVIRRTVAPENALAEVIARGRIFTDAGGDGLFVPGLTRATDLEEIVASTALPFNAMLRPGLPEIPELKRLGVRRLTVATHLAEVAYAAMARSARELLGTGTYGALVAGELTYHEANALFEKRPESRGPD